MPFTIDGKFTWGNALTLFALFMTGVAAWGVQQSTVSAHDLRISQLETTIKAIVVDRGEANVALARIEQHTKDTDEGVQDLKGSISSLSAKVDVLSGRSR